MARGLIAGVDTAGLHRLGPRLRAARRARRLTVQEVSELAGLTGSTVSRAERNERSLSVNSLAAVCEVLGITIGTLFDAPATYCVKAGEGPKIAFNTTAQDARLISPRGEEQFQAINIKINPAGLPLPPDVDLSGDLALFHVLAGTVKVDVDQEVHHLKEGDSITLKGDDLSAIWAPGPKVANLLLFLVPIK